MCPAGKGTVGVPPRTIRLLVGADPIRIPRGFPWRDLRSALRPRSRSPRVFPAGPKASGEEAGWDAGGRWPPCIPPGPPPRPADPFTPWPPPKKRARPNRPREARVDRAPQFTRAPRCGGNSGGVHTHPPKPTCSKRSPRGDPRRGPRSLAHTQPPRSPHTGANPGARTGENLRDPAKDPPPIPPHFHKDRLKAPPSLRNLLLQPQPFPPFRPPFYQTRANFPRRIPPSRGFHWPHFWTGPSVLIESEVRSRGCCEVGRTSDLGH